MRIALAAILILGVTYGVCGVIGAALEQLAVNREAMYDASRVPSKGAVAAVRP